MDKQMKEVLDHIGRYTISIGKVIDGIEPEGGRASLSRLLREGLIQRNSGGLDGNYSYYQLTSKGAKISGVPANRARPKEPKGLALELATLWFSFMSEKTKKRLTSDDLKALFGAPKGGNVVHVAQDAEDDDTMVFRIFVPSATAPLRSVLPTLRKSAFDVVGDENLLRWVERGTYGFAVLLHSEERREDLANMIRDEEFPDIRIHLDVAPSPSNLREFVKPDSAPELI